MAFPVGMPDEECLVMSYTAYFDESGTHQDSDNVTVAGFVSLASRWVEFSGQWQMALNDFGLDYFHMSEFANRVSPYDEWTEAERRQHLTRLLNIIKNNILGSVGISIPKETFDAVFTERAKAICGGAYGLAAVACFFDLAETLRSSEINGRVAYVFESGAKGAADITRVFNANLNDPIQNEKMRLLSLRFENKRDSLPLQAADILAYELYRDLPRTLKWDERSHRYPLTILAGIPRKWGFLDGIELKKWSDILSFRAALEDTGELPRL